MVKERSRWRKRTHTRTDVISGCILFQRSDTHGRVKLSVGYFQLWLSCSTQNKWEWLSELNILFVTGIVLLTAGAESFYSVHCPTQHYRIVWFWHFLIASCNFVFTFFNWICVANRFTPNVCSELDLCFYTISLLEINLFYVCAVFSRECLLLWLNCF